MSYLFRIYHKQILSFESLKKGVCIHLNRTCLHCSRVGHFKRLFRSRRSETGIKWSWFLMRNLKVGWEKDVEVTFCVLIPNYCGPVTVYYIIIVYKRLSHCYRLREWSWCNVNDNYFISSISIVAWKMIAKTTVTYHLVNNILPIIYC